MTTGGAATPSSVRDDPSDPAVRSHLTLRLTIGFIALLLPLFVMAVVAAREGMVLPSISDSYYHRYSNSAFIGAMCAFAAFLWSYQYPGESGLGNAAAVSAAGVAFFPTFAKPFPPHNEFQWGGTLHYTATGTFFVILSIFCFKWARNSQGESSRPYYSCGGLILLALVLVVLSDGVWFILSEVLAVVTFGFAWLLRGGASRRATAGALVSVTIPILLIAFVSGAWEWKRLMSALLLVVGFALLCAVLWKAQPGRSENRYVPGSDSG